MISKYFQTLLKYGWRRNETFVGHEAALIVTLVIDRSNWGRSIPITVLTGRRLWAAVPEKQKERL